MSKANVPKLPGSSASPPSLSSASPNQPKKEAGNTNLLLIAMLLALLAVVLNVVLINKISAANEVGTFTVWQLTRPVKDGDKISDRDLKQVSIPTSQEPAYANAIKSRLELINWMQNTVKMDAPDGATVTYDLFAGSTGERALVRLGYRRVGLQVDNRAMPAELAPGDLVDIYAPLPGETILVIENIRLIAMNRGRTAVELELSVKHVDILLSMMAKLDRQPFIVVKRNPNDNKMIYPEGVNPMVYDLLDKPRPN